MISLNMKTQTRLEKKLADWTEAFYSIPNQQSQEAKILKELASGLKNKIKQDGITIIPGVA